MTAKGPLKTAMVKTCWISLLISAVVFFLFSVTSFAVVRHEATVALEQWSQKTYEPNDRQWLQVHEINTADAQLIDTPLVDDAIIVGYQTGLNRGHQADDHVVYHYSTFPYDAFFMGLGPSGQGDSIAFVDTRFIGSLCFFFCTTIAIGVFAASLLVGFYHACYQLSRDREGEAMEAIFANASHELKNPLVAIRGYAEAMKCGAISKALGTEKIFEVTERMNETVESILMISRVDSRQVEPKLEKHDIREIIYDAAKLIEIDCIQGGVRLEMNLPYPIIRSCDQDMLFTVFTNVLGNARRHAESTIRVSQAVSDKKTLIIHFDNDGMPPNQEDLPHVFERFYRGSSGESGIGLALSREYLELLGGDITMIPLDQGTRIRITL